MKKEYNKPEAIVVEIRSAQMMATSPSQSYDAHKLNIIEVDIEPNETLVW